jgi:hypothetical protein
LHLLCIPLIKTLQDIVPESLREKALAVMVENARDTEFIAAPSPGSDPNGVKYNCTDCGGGPGAHMTAGLFSVKWFLMALADGGMNDVAYETITTPSYPGYGASVDLECRAQMMLSSDCTHAAYVRIDGMPF